MRAISVLMAVALLLVAPQISAQCSLPECDSVRRTTTDIDRYQERPYIRFVQPEKAWWQKVRVSASSERDSSRFWLTGEPLPIPERGLQFGEGSKFPVRLEMVLYETRGATSSKFSVGIHGRRGAGVLWKCTFHEFNFNC